MLRVTRRMGTRSKQNQNKKGKKMKAGDKIKLSGLKQNGADYERILTVRKVINPSYDESLELVTFEESLHLTYNVQRGKLTGKKGRFVADCVYHEAAYSAELTAEKFGVSISEITQATGKDAETIKNLHSTNYLAFQTLVFITIDFLYQKQGGAMADSISAENSTLEPMNQSKSKLTDLKPEIQQAIFNAWLDKRIQYYKQSEGAWKKLRASAALRKSGVYRPVPIAEKRQFCKNHIPRGEFKTLRDAENG